MSHIRAGGPRTVLRPVIRAAGCLLVLSLLVVGRLMFAPAAPACACGAAPNPENARMTGEAALITWDGRTETIDMVLRLGGPASEAAWVMPTPIGAELGLGDNEVWQPLARAVAPEAARVPDWTPRFDFFARRGVGGAPGGGVSVERVTDVGPFRVTTLSGDASAVTEWLRANGYPARPELEPTFQGYLDGGWRIQAVRLIPEAAGEMFQSSLPPLRMRFATDRVSYPIRLSRHATVDQRVTLYLAAPYRMGIGTDAAPSQPLELLYAGWQPGTVVNRPTGLTPDRLVFLTAWSGTVSPSSFVDDYEFTRAAQGDAEFVRTYPVPDHAPGRALGAVIALGVPLLLLGTGVGIGVRAARRRRRP